MIALKLADMLRKYEGLWVAMNRERTQVLASGQSIEQAIDLAKQKTLEEPILTFVSRLDLDYVGWMKFPYQERPRQPSEAFPDDTRRLVSLVPVTLTSTSKEKSITLDALVDSGADSCIFPGMIGIALGINVHEGPKQLISGLGGRQVEARFHYIKLRIGNIQFDVYAGFSFDTIGISGLLGQRGFFDNLRVVFDRTDNSVIINRRSCVHKLLTKLGV